VGALNLDNFYIDYTVRLNNTSSLGGIAITNDNETLFVGTEQEPPTIFLLDIETYSFKVRGTISLNSGNFVRQISLSPKSNVAYATTSCGYQSPCTQNYTAVISLLTNKPGSHKQDVNWWWILIIPAIFSSFLVGSCFYIKGRELWFVTIPTNIRTLFCKYKIHVPLKEEDVESLYPEKDDILNGD